MSWLWRTFNPVGRAASYAAEWAFDKIRDAVDPQPGCVVYCDFHLGLTEHSGIYIGENKIVHLNGKGEVRAVSPRVFLQGTTGLNIQVSCRDSLVASDLRIAERAISMIGTTRQYNFILDNCHQFSAGCLSGDFDNPCNFLWMLKVEAARRLGATTWRIWDR